MLDKRQLIFSVSFIKKTFCDGLLLFTELLHVDNQVMSLRESRKRSDSGCIEK